MLMGRYKVLTGEFADLMLGYYGATIGERDPEIVEAARAQTKKEPITCAPADLLKPEWERLVAEAIALEGCDGSDEDVLTFAMFPQVAPISSPSGPRAQERRQATRPRRPPDELAKAARRRGRSRGRSATR